MTGIVIYSKDYCPYCKRAKQMLAALGLDYHEVEVSDNKAALAEMQQLSGRKTVPQVFVGGTHIGGSDDLTDAIRSGRLAKLISAAA